MTARISRRRLIAGAGAGLAAGAFAAPAVAAWPDRRITILHGFAAGGNADVVARIVADALTPRLGQTVVVEPRPGAGGTIAANLISHAAPDGYTVGILPGGHTVSAAIYKKLPYDPVDGFATLGMIGDFPFVLATYPDHPAKDLRAMLERGKTQEITYGTPGNGTGQHMAVELLVSYTGAKLRHVPYKGGSAAILDLFGKRLDLVMDTPTVMISNVQAKKVRALGVTGAGRFFALPDVPTIAEQGVNGYETSSWLALAAPAGLPKDIASSYNTHLRAVLADPAVIARLQKIGINPLPGPGSDMRARLVREIARWQKVVAERRIPRI